jgi:hypothetical protein
MVAAPRIVLPVVALALTASVARAGVLFDPGLGTVPASQGWQYVPNPNNGPVAQGLTPTAVVLDTTADRLDRAGYFSRLPTIPPFPPFPQHPGMPVLDRNAGFTLTFDAIVVQEGHNVRDDNGDGKDDRSGFSVIIVTQDQEAIEVGFFEDRVWAQNDDANAAIELFTQAEGVAFDTTLGARFGLTIEGATYTLRAGSVVILSGPLRNYTSATGTAGLVYKTAGLVFLGDNTGSADALVGIGEVRIDVPAREYCPGDVNGDGVTNEADFTVLAANFGIAVSPGRSGDLTADGVVSSGDFTVLAGDFGCVSGN